MEEYIRQNDKKIDDLTNVVREHIDSSFSKRELDHYFQELNKTLARIETQVIKTNGRVTVLELWKENIMAKITVLIAGIGIIWTLAKEFIIK